MYSRNEMQETVYCVKKVYKHNHNYLNKKKHRIVQVARDYFTERVTKLTRDK